MLSSQQCFSVKLRFHIKLNYYPRPNTGKILYVQCITRYVQDILIQYMQWRYLCSGTSNTDRQMVKCFYHC